MCLIFVWLWGGLGGARDNLPFSLGVCFGGLAPAIDRAFLQRFYFDENETNFTIEIHDLLTNHKNCGH